MSESKKISIEYIGRVGWSNADSTNVLLVGFGFVSQSPVSDRNTNPPTLVHKGDDIKASIKHWRSKDGSKERFYAVIEVI